MHVLLFTLLVTKVVVTYIRRYYIHPYKELQVYKIDMEEFSSVVNFKFLHEESHFVRLTGFGIPDLP